MKKIRLTKFIYHISTAIIFVAGIAPGNFNIPIVLRPWIFIASITWLVIFSLGVFNL